MTCFLVMVPTNSRETFALYHEELPRDWPQTLKDRPGAEVIWEFAEPPASLDEAVVYARHAREYGVV